LGRAGVGLFFLVQQLAERRFIAATGDGYNRGLVQSITGQDKGQEAWDGRLHGSSSG
jgi:hypothetical protein